MGSQLRLQHYKFYDREEDKFKIAVERYFFLYHVHPVTRKVKGKNGTTETKTDYVQNYVERDNFIKLKGQGDLKRGKKIFLKLCEKDEHWNSLKDIPVPSRFSWIWIKFLDIWRACERDMSGYPIITYRTIQDYADCMNVPFTREDKQELLKIKVWAMNTVIKLNEKE